MLLLEMMQGGLEPNVFTYSAAISAREKGRRPVRALELLDEMKQRGSRRSRWKTNWGPPAGGT